ncbi:MOSC domain-containing protein [Apibacter sp. B3706]|uniref:MOSC domain-containing protein n=1 Tax=Apibacter TaxID=1778601 RepID=UPI00140B6382|nr:MULTISPECIES: MOSC domain-containing protein [Apibacter]QII70285.1 MOSC domain-containing protein [Apibacter sp. B3706]QYN50667.1 MOSC domain-containing protein [Apibacter sp. ESL0404]
MKKPLISSLHAGKIQRLANTEYQSAINKKKVTDSQKVSKLGLINDEQSDKINHGGEEKAVHQYAFENYEYWKTSLPELPLLEKSGAFGENISSLGMTEETVMIGDIYKIGSCVLEVSQARQPCWKLNYHFQCSDMSLRVQESLKTGWYYRVLEEGSLKQGDTIELIDRPYPEYSLTYLLTILYKKENCLDKEILNKLLKIKSLALSWKKIFSNRLENGTIENWDKRLFK